MHPYKITKHYGRSAFLCLSFLVLTYFLNVESCSYSVCILFVLAFLGILYPYNRGLLSTSLVLLYSLTSVVAGYITSSFHNQFCDAGWVISSL